MQIFQALGAPPPDPRAPPQLRISSYAPATLCNVYNYTGVGSFCFEQFFLHRTVAIVFWLKNFICITQCVTLIPFCYIALSYLFAKV